MNIEPKYAFFGSIKSNLYNFLFFQYPVNGKPKSVIYWLAELVNNNTEIKLSHEHQSYAWCNLESAKSCVQYEDMKNLLTEAHSYILNKIKSRSS